MHDVSAGGSGIQLLTKDGTGPIGGLTPGDTYYVHYTNGTDFELTDASGTPIPGINASGDSGTSSLTVIGKPLGPGQGSGIQSLVVDLTGSGGGVMLGVGGAGALIGGNAGNNVPSSTATGVGGGAISVQVGISTTNSTPTVTTTISSGATLTGLDVAVFAGSAANGAADASNAGGGLISGQHSGATVNITNNVTTQVDGNITALRDIQTLASSTESPSVSAKVDGGGLIAFGDANANAPTTHHTVVNLTGTLTAGRTILGEARDGFNGLLTAQANAAGLGTDANAGESGSLAIGAGSTATTEVVVTGGTLDGQLVYLSGDVGAQHTINADGSVGNGGFTNVPGATQVSGVKATARSSAESDALGASARATGEIDVNDIAGVFLSSATITGDSVQLHARHENQSFSTSADAACDCGGGYAGAHAPLNYNSQSNVTADASTTITTAGLLVDTYQNLGWSFSYNAHGGLFVDHNGDANLSDTGTREIHWSATTYLLGDPNPVLTVDASGTIVAKSSDVHVYQDSSGGPELQIGATIAAGHTIVVAPILYKDPPTALFEANANNGISNTPDSTIDNDPSGTAIFFMQETWNSVTIINKSDRAMIMQGTGSPMLSIDTLNQSLANTPESNVNISVKIGAQNNPSTFQADVKHLFVATEVLVESTRGPPVTGYDLTFQGGIDNTIGTTTLRNDRGDIIVANGAGPFTSNALHLIATDGSVGCATNNPSCTTSSPLDAVLVQYATGPTGSPTINDVVLDGTAFYDFHLELTTVRRDSTVASIADITPQIGPLHAGRDIVISVDNSNEGIVPVAVGNTDFVQFIPDALPPSPEGACTVPGSNVCVPTVEHFRPDPAGATAYICTVASRTCVADAFVLIAYAADTKAINADYTFTDPSTANGTGLIAGDDIDIHHDSQATAITFTLFQVVDGTFTFESRSYGNHDNVGRIDLFTNGTITDTEASGNLRAGQIQATGKCSSASLCPTAIPADVILNSPAAVLDVSNDATVPMDHPSAVGSNVIGRNITITAGDNGIGTHSGRGGVGTPTDFLLIQVNADGVDAGSNLGVLTVTDTAEDRANIVLGTNLPPGSGTYGVFITQTNDNGSNGDMEIKTVTTNGDTSLTTTNGSIRDARGGTAAGPGINTPASILPPNIFANNVDLNALGGSVGDANGLDDLKVYSSANLGASSYCGQTYTLGYQDGNYQNASPGERTVSATCHLAAQADESVFITETPGVPGVAAPMDVLLAWARNGNVRLTTTETDADGNGVACLNAAPTFAGQNAACANPTVTAGNDIALIHTGTTLVTENSLETTWGAGTGSPSVYATTPTSFGLIEAQKGNVELVAADDVVTDSSSQILATTAATGSGNGGDPNQWSNPTGNIDIYGDSHPGLSDPGPGDGTAIVLRGSVTPGSGGGLTRVFGNGEADTIIFDQTYLGGQTRAYGSATPTAPHTFALSGDGAGTCTQASPPNNGSGCDDTFIVNHLPSMVALGTDAAAADTLTLDGQSGNNVYDIYTAGSQFGQNNYEVNVLGTHGPTDGTDTLNIYGFDTYNGLDTPTPGGPDNTGSYCGAGTAECATNDIFLLRSVPYLQDQGGSETAARPSLYQGTGDCSAPDSTPNPSGSSAGICSGGAGFVAVLHAHPTGSTCNNTGQTALEVAQAVCGDGTLANGGTTPIYGVERINYDSSLTGGVHVYSAGGNDYFAVDDNAAPTYLDGGSGDNQFQIGQLYGDRRTSVTDPSAPAPPPTYGQTGGLAAENVFDVATVATTRGWLSRGTSSPLVADGGTGNNVFTVYSNQAVLHLQGDGGNNLFIVRGFALAETDTAGNIILPGGCSTISAPYCLPIPITTNGFSTAAETDVRTGAGNNQVEYNMNAPVSVDGGSGFNKLIILGTEFADHIVVTDHGIFGAGMSVTYRNIEVIEIDALEGDDTIDVLSTPPGVAVRVIGGDGSNQINVAGDVNGNVYSQDIDGTSSTINNDVLTQDQLYQDLVIPGVALSVAQGSQGAVIVTENAGGTVVQENGSGYIGTVDNYNVRLGQQPTGTVYVTVTAEPDMLSDRSASNFGDSILLATGSAPPAACVTTAACAFYQQTTYDGQEVDVAQRAVVLVFDATNWMVPQQVWVGAVNDPLQDGTRVYEVSHSVLSADPFFDNAVVRNVEVTKIDTGVPGILVSNIGNSDTPGIYSDGVGTGAATFTSQTATFVTGDVNQPIVETDGGGDIAAGTKIIASAQTARLRRLSASVSADSGITFSLPSRMVPPRRLHRRIRQRHHDLHLELGKLHAERSRTARRRDRRRRAHRAGHGDRQGRRRDPGRAVVHRERLRHRVRAHEPSRRLPELPRRPGHRRDFVDLVAHRRVQCRRHRPPDRGDRRWRAHPARHGRPRRDRQRNDEHGHALEADSRGGLVHDRLRAPVAERLEHRPRGKPGDRDHRLLRGQPRRAAIGGGDGRHQRHRNRNARLLRQPLERASERRSAVPPGQRAVRHDAGQLHDHVQPDELERAGRDRRQLGAARRSLRPAQHVRHRAGRRGGDARARIRADAGREHAQQPARRPGAEQPGGRRCRAGAVRHGRHEVRQHPVHSAGHRFELQHSADRGPDRRHERVAQHRDGCADHRRPDVHPGRRADQPCPDRCSGNPDDVHRPRDDRGQHDHARGRPAEQLPDRGLPGRPARPALRRYLRQHPERDDPDGHRQLDEPQREPDCRRLHGRFDRPRRQPGHLQRPGRLQRLRTARWPRQLPRHPDPCRRIELARRRVPRRTALPDQRLRPAVQDPGADRHDRDQGRRAGRHGGHLRSHNRQGNGRHASGVHRRRDGHHNRLAQGVGGRSDVYRPGRGRRPGQLVRAGRDPGRRRPVLRRAPRQHAPARVPEDSASAVEHRRPAVGRGWADR